MTWHYIPIAGVDTDLERNFRSLEAALNGGGSVSLVKLGSDVGPTGSAALANVTGLSFSAVANTSYHFQFTVLFQVSAGTIGIALAVTSPAGSTIDYAVEIPAQGDATNADYNGQGTFSGDAVTAPTAPAGNVTFVARITGVLQNGATPGTLQVQYAASVAGATTATVKAGSAGILHTLP